MDSGALLKLWRTRVFDAVEPYLWSDAEALAYMDEAQKQYCRSVRGIADSMTPAVTQAPVTQGNGWVPLDHRVTEVRSAYLVSLQRTLKIRNDGEVEPRELALPGNPHGLVVGETAGYVRLDRVPLANDTLQLSVYRLPLNDIADKITDLEIPEQHQMLLLDGISAQAYLKDDVETRDENKAQQAKDRFEAGCKKAYSEMVRLRGSRGTVAYGGIPMFTNAPLSRRIR